MKCLICHQLPKYLNYNPSFPNSAIYECKKCQFAMTYPLPKSEKISEFYQNPNYYANYTNRNKFTQSEARFSMARRRALSQFDFIEQSLPDSSKDITALELGCADGSLLLLLEKYGFNVIGYEPDTTMANIARERLVNAGSQVFNQMIKEENLGTTSYDLICSSHVFEHLAYPIAHLDAIKKALKEDGLLFLEIPNQYYLNNFVGDNAKKNGHLYFYSMKAIKNLLLTNGFKIISLTTCGKSVKEVRSKDKSKKYLGGNAILKRFQNKILKKFPQIMNKVNSIETTSRQDPFNTYWGNQRQQGQWIRVLASPQK